MLNDWSFEFSFGMRLNIFNLGGVIKRIGILGKFRNGHICFFGGKLDLDVPDKDANNLLKCFAY